MSPTITGIYCCSMMLQLLITIHDPLRNCLYLVVIKHEHVSCHSTIKSFGTPSIDNLKWPPTTGFPAMYGCSRPSCCKAKAEWQTHQCSTQPAVDHLPIRRANLSRMIMMQYVHLCRAGPRPGFPHFRQLPVMRSHETYLPQVSQSTNFQREQNMAATTPATRCSNAKE